MGVDAIRLDTVKHVERNNLLEYVNAWKAHKPSVFVFGENLVKGYGWGDMGGGDNGPSPIRPWWYTRLGNDPRNPNSGGDSGFAVLDFGLFSSFRDNISRGNYQGIAQAMSMDWIYGDPTTLITFLQNHDVGPDNDFRDRFRGDDWMAAAAYNVLWTVRGIPCLYYGEEIAFMRGRAQDVTGNNDTLDMTGRAYFGDHLTDQRIAATQSHPLYRHIRRLNQIRRAVPALQKGEIRDINEWGSGMRFVRDLDDGASYAVVGLAIGGDQDITVGNIRNGTYRDAVSGREVGRRQRQPQLPRPRQLGRHLRARRSRQDRRGRRLPALGQRQTPVRGRAQARHIGFSASRCACSGVIPRSARPVGSSSRSRRRWLARALHTSVSPARARTALPNR